VKWLKFDIVCRSCENVKRGLLFPRTHRSLSFKGVICTAVAKASIDFHCSRLFAVGSIKQNPYGDTPTRLHVSGYMLCVPLRTFFNLTACCAQLFSRLFYARFLFRSRAKLRQNCFPPFVYLLICPTAELSATFLGITKRRVTYMECK